MSQSSEGRRPRRNNELLDSAEDFAAGVGRLSYSLLSLGLDLLPGQSRTHMHRAVRELSYAFAELPRSFADIAGEAIEEWAAEGETGAATMPRGAARVRRVRVYDAGRGADGAAAAPTAAGQSVATVAIAHIEYDPPGRDVDGEFVLLRNTTVSSVDLTGWRLHDSKANHVFVFPSFALAPGAEVKIWTKAGPNDDANLFWGERGAIWNNDGDAGTLKDAAGAVVSSFAYAGSK